jgi:hypothetical protein
MNSSFALYDTQTSGGAASVECTPGFNNDCRGSGGGDGAFVANGFLFAAHSQFTGGNAGPPDGCGEIGCTGTCMGGLGGSGILLEKTSSTALLLSDSFHPGAAGPPGAGGTEGPGMNVNGVGATTLPGRARVMAIPNPVRELTTVPIRINGQPGDAVYLFTSMQTSFRYVPNYEGVQIPQHPPAPTFLGMIGATGVLTTQITFPDLGPGAQEQNFYLQCAHQDVQGHWTLGTPASLIVLDQAF